MSNGPFGIDPEEFDRAVREAAENLLGSLESVGKYFDRGADVANWSSVIDGLVRRKPSRGGRETEAAGVWVIYTLSGDGSAHVEQVFPNEIDALRSNKDNVDPHRKVRFLPFGVAVSVLDREDA
jgi:hypothetical protein